MPSRLAKEGARVALLGRTLTSLDVIASQIRAAGGTALPLTCNVTQADQVERARAEIPAPSAHRGFS